MPKIEIKAGDIAIEAELNDTPTAQAIWKALPITGRVNTWGKEIYFEIPVRAEQEPDARAEIEVGELGYWPVGNAFCIFWGPTPVSTDNKPRAYSPVNIIGRVCGPTSPLDQIPTGETIHVKRAPRD